MVQDTPKHNIVGWFEIYVNDLERAVHFYSELMNISIDDFIDLSNKDIKMRAFPWVEGGEFASGALVEHTEANASFPMPMKGGRGGTLVYLHSEDCAVETRRAEHAGGKLLHDKHKIGEGYGYCAFIEDTEGNVVGIHSKQ